jgi:hypothetical protein
VVFDARSKLEAKISAVIIDGR